MREILFRAKPVAVPHTTVEPWVFGSCLNLRANDKCYILDGTVWVGTLQPVKIEVSPETVGQYTGLKDKHGRKIFEGDIVEAWSQGVKARGVVKQRADGFWLMYPAWQNGKAWGLCPDFSTGETTVEVIGNIHDNPELLEVPAHA